MKVTRRALCNRPVKGFSQYYLDHFPLFYASTAKAAGAHVPAQVLAAIKSK